MGSNPAGRTINWVLCGFEGYVIYFPKPHKIFIVHFHHLLSVQIAVWHHTDFICARPFISSHRYSLLSSYHEKIRVLLIHADHPPHGGFHLPFPAGLRQGHRLLWKAISIPVQDQFSITACGFIRQYHRQPELYSRLRQIVLYFNLLTMIRRKAKSFKKQIGRAEMTRMRIALLFPFHLSYQQKKTCRRFCLSATRPLLRPQRGCHCITNSGSCLKRFLFFPYFLLLPVTGSTNSFIDTSQRTLYSVHSNNVKYITILNLFRLF